MILRYSLLCISISLSLHAGENNNLILSDNQYDIDETRSFITSMTLAKVTINTQEIINKKIDPNATSLLSIDGDSITTPILAFAIKHQQAIETIEALIKAGAKISETDYASVDNSNFVPPLSAMTEVFDDNTTYANQVTKLLLEKKPDSPIDKSEIYKIIITMCNKVPSKYSNQDFKAEVQKNQLTIVDALSKADNYLSTAPSDKTLDILSLIICNKQNHLLSLLNNISNKSEIASNLLPIAIALASSDIDMAVQGNNFANDTSTSLKVLLCMHANPYAANFLTFKESLFIQKKKLNEAIIAKESSFLLNKLPYNILSKSITSNIAPYNEWKKYYKPRERLFNRFIEKALNGTLRGIEKNAITNTFIRITDHLPALPFEVIGIIFNYMGFSWTFKNHEDRIKKSYLKSNLNDLSISIDSLSNDDKTKTINTLVEKEFPGLHILGLSPLQWIYKKTNNLYLVKACIDAGMKDEGSVAIPTLLYAIARSQTSDIDPELLEYFKNNNKIDAKDVGNNTPLHTAIQYNNIYIMKTLIEAGADINAQDLLENRPLHIAAASLDKDVIQYLIKNGATIDVFNSQKQTPLIMAIAHKNISAATALISSGADINVNNNRPLHIAVALQDEDIMTLLINNNAIVDDIVIDMCNAKGKDHFKRTYNLLMSTQKKNSDTAQ